MGTRREGPLLRPCAGMADGLRTPSLHTVFIRTRWLCRDLQTDQYGVFPMKKTSLTRALFLAGIVAAAGVAQAQVQTDKNFDSPQRAGEASTMTHGQPNAQTTNSPYSDGTVI